RLDRALGPESVDVAGAVEDRLDQLGHLELLRRRLEGDEKGAEGRDGLEWRRADAGLLGVGERLEERDPVRVGVHLELRDRRVADATPGPVRDAGQRDRVERI